MIIIVIMYLLIETTAALINTAGMVIRMCPILSVRMAWTMPIG